MQALVQRRLNDSSGSPAASLQSITDSLEANNRGSEPTFIKLGEQLQLIFQQAMDMEAQASSAVGLVDQRSGCSILTEISRLTQSCVSELRGWQTRIAERLNNVGDVAARLGHLAPSSVELKKIAKRLNTINVYFAVESSRSNEAANAFSAYTAELAKLVQHILEVTADIEHDSIDAQTKQKRAHETISRGSSELNSLADIAEAAMLEASSEVDELVTFTASAMNHIGQLSKEVSRQMGNVVMSLQFHDIVRQQIEHVVEALREAEQLLKNDEDEALGRAYSILRVQAAQLKQATVTIRNAHNTIEQSFQSIGEQSGELLSGIAVDDSGNLQCSELKAGLTRLIEALETLQLLLRDAQALGAQTGEAADMASKASLLLSQRAERVDDINMDISTQALNAVVTSVRLREKGLTLAILAEEVTSLSRRCDDFVSTIVADLGQINEIAQDMSDAGHLKAAKDEAEGTDTVAQLSEAVERVTGTCESYEGHSMAMVQRARQVREMVASAGQMLEFLPEMANQLEEYAVWVDGVIEAVKSGLPEDYADRSALEEHAERYTMESERETHKRALGTGESTERRQEDESTTIFEFSSSGESSEGDDLGDNVDLF